MSQYFICIKIKISYVANEKRLYTIELRMGLGRNYVNNLIWSGFARWAVLLGWSASTMSTVTAVTTATMSAADWSQTAADAASAADAADSADSADAATDAAAAQVNATARATQSARDIAAADWAAWIAAAAANRFLLCLILDEVYFWLAWLCWSSSWDDNFLLFFWFLDQYVDQCLLFVLRSSWDDWCLIGWWGWRLNEDNFVVLLSLGYWNLTLDRDLFWLWWRHMHIDVLLHNGGTAAAVSAVAGVATIAGTCESWKKRIGHHCE